MAELPAWVRGTGGERARIEQALDEDLRNGRDATFRTLYIGQAALRLMRGIAVKGDVESVMLRLISDLELEVQECATALFGSNDLHSEQARDAHFKGRVAASILHRLNICIASGQEAADSINEEFNHGRD